MRTIAAALILVFAAVLPPSTARAAEIPVRRTVERTAAAAARVRIDNSVGDVQVFGDDGTTVRVTARIRSATDEAAAKVGVDVVRTGDETAVSVNVPRSSPAWVHWIFDRSHTSVDLVVHVPRRSMLAARLSVGDLDVRGIAATIDAHSSTGDVHLHDVAADASAITSTGDVGIELAFGWNGTRLTARTSTGDVRIRATPGLRAHVEARTSTGDVHNALGSANVASPVIEARTSTGDVTITTH